MIFERVVNMFFEGGKGKADVMMTGARVGDLLVMVKGCRKRICFLRRWAQLGVFSRTLSSLYLSSQPENLAPLPHSRIPSFQPRNRETLPHFGQCKPIPKSADHQLRFLPSTFLSFRHPSPLDFNRYTGNYLCTAKAMLRLAHAHSIIADFKPEAIGDAESLPLGPERAKFGQQELQELFRLSSCPD